MAPVVEDIRQQPTQAQLRLLHAHLPYSLPVLRRLQVAAGAFDTASPGKVVGAGTSPHAHVVFVYDDSTNDAADAADAADTPFVAAYVDLASYPETAAFVYASDQDTTDTAHEPLFPADPPLTDVWPVDRGAELIAAWSPARRARSRRLVVHLLRYIRALAQTEAAAILPLLAKRAQAAAAADNFTRKLKINIHEGLRHLLQHPEAAGAAPSVKPVTLINWPYDKWLFRLEDVPVLSDLKDTELLVTVPAKDGSSSSPTPLAWDCVHTPADLDLVISRTYVPRTHATLLSVPSVALRDTASGVLQAWAFLGTDGSLWTLHTEPAYRGLGLAKTLASRLFWQYCGVFGSAAGAGDGDGDGDGWIMADVSSDNRQSQGVCRRLGAKRAWATSWVVLDYESLGDDE